jgi:hypothetical protein
MYQALIMYYIALGASYTKTNATFQIPWAIQILPALVMFIGLYFLPRSPRWLASKDQLDEALQVLADLHGNRDSTAPIVQAEFIEIKEAIELNSAMGHVQWSELVDPKNFQRISIGIFVHIWTQLSGKCSTRPLILGSLGWALIVPQGTTLYYTISRIYSRCRTYRKHEANCGIYSICDKRCHDPSSDSFPGHNWASTCSRIWLRYDDDLAIRNCCTSQSIWIRSSWRPGWTACGNMVVRGPASKAVIACTYLLVGTYSTTWAPTSWLYPAEIYPIRLRGKAVSVATSANWIFGFAVSYLTPPSFQNLAWKTFLIFGTFNVAAGLHAYFFFPETKGKSLEGRLSI